MCQHKHLYVVLHFKYSLSYLLSLVYLLALSQFVYLFIAVKFLEPTVNYVQDV